MNQSDQLKMQAMQIKLIREIFIRLLAKIPPGIITAKEREEFWQMIGRL